MRHIQAPKIFSPKKSSEWERTLFIGGGISGTTVWQDKMVKLLTGTNLILLNPRRKKFDVKDPMMTVEQIEWEFYHLRFARARMFWFPPETLCPITLFELGKYIESSDRLFVGVDPKYARYDDVQTQLTLARPGDSKIDCYLSSLAVRIKRGMCGRV